MGAAVTCCGKQLSPLEAVKAPEEDRLSVEIIENDYFISSSHPMTKEHYVSFVALVTGDTLILRRLYPEWDLQTRLPRIGHGSSIGTASSTDFFTSWCNGLRCGILGKTTSKQGVFLCQTNFPAPACWRGTQPGHVCQCPRGRVRRGGRGRLLR